MKSLNIKSKLIIDHTTPASVLLTTLLTNRGVVDSKQKEFFNPPSPSSPTNINLKSAIKILNQSIKAHQQILIYGDYDVDGLVSTALLWLALNKLHANVTPFIPDRNIDGYGFNAKSFLRFQKEKNIVFDLLITVDNGIVAALEFFKIQKQNLKIIIIDHHLPSSDLPSVDAIIHSTDYSASALSWYLSQKFDSQADIGLAALGTVADCLSLTGQNRSFVVHGLNTIRVNPNPGIKKLIEISKIKQETISTYDLGFIIAPRLNAVGRLSNPTDALRLICSSSPLQTAKYANNLNNLNQERQDLQQESIKLAETIYQKHSSKLIFVSHESFHPGIIGLIAGKLTEKYYLPSIVISQGNKVSKGSCRSIPQVNIIETLRQVSDLFLDLGGHPAASGFTIKNTNIPKLQKKLTKIIDHQLSGINLLPTIDIEAQMTLSAVNLKNIKLIKKFEPFGVGNPQPLFFIKNLKIVSKRLVGSSGDHLKLKLDDPDTSYNENITANYFATATGIDAIAFKQGQLDKQLTIGQTIDIVASLDLNNWNGNVLPQLIVKEIFFK